MNLGAQKLRAATPATIAVLAAELGIERTYCGRILSGDRTPGLGLRRTIRSRYGVGLDDWEQAPDPEQFAETRKRTGTLD